MKTETITKVSEGLLAHLHLSHAQAAVMVDDPRKPKKLTVYIFDEDVARQVKNIGTWEGLAVGFVKSRVQPQ